MRFLAATAVVALLSAASPVLAAEDLTTKQAGQVVDTLITDLNGYFDPAKAARVQAALRADRARLAGIHDRAALAEALSAITLKVSQDQHLKVSVATANAGASELSEANAVVKIGRGQAVPNVVGIAALPFQIGRNVRGDHQVNVATADLDVCDHVGLQARAQHHGERPACDADRAARLLDQAIGAGAKRRAGGVVDGEEIAAERDGALLPAPHLRL